MLFNNRESATDYLKGVFLGNKNLTNEEYQDKIHLMFEFSYKTDYYKHVLDSLQNFTTYKTMYNPDDIRTMLVYDVPEQFKKDYQLFKNSKYSRISEILKQRIIKLWKFPPDDRSVKILYRDSSLREELEDKYDCRISEDAEVVTVLNENLEYFNDSMKKYKTKMEKIRAKFDQDGI